MQLDPSATRAGVQLLARDTVASTNDEARRLARNGEGGPLWITASAQARGRGRGGRSWHSPPGNLYASLLLRNPAAAERAPELAFVAGLATRDAIVAEAPALAPRLSLKWPNDILLGGEKCAGILIEGEVEPGISLSVVIGIGVNCAHHPEAALPPPPDVEPALMPHATLKPPLFPATDLRSHGFTIGPERLFASLSATMLRRIAHWDHGRGFAAIRDDWLASAHGIGEAIRVRDNGNERSGRFLGLDPDGRLLLELPGGHVDKVTAGDVFPFTLRGGGRPISSERA
jgi:BirA family transcriptional regulator, biotin operon repressor / biotin---[acetyl-CoA-carboxylase] ligase